MIAEQVAYAWPVMGDVATLVVGGGDAVEVVGRFATDVSEARGNGAEDDGDAATSTDGGTDEAAGCAGAPAHASTIGANTAAANL